MCVPLFTRGLLLRLLFCTAIPNVKFERVCAFDGNFVGDSDPVDDDPRYSHNSVSNTHRRSRGSCQNGHASSNGSANSNGYSRSRTHPHHDRHHSWFSQLTTPSGIMELTDRGLHYTEVGFTAMCSSVVAPLVPPSVSIAPRFRRPLIVLVMIITVALAYRVFIGRPNLAWLVPGQMPGDIAYHSDDGRIGIYIPFTTFAVFSILGNYLASLAVGGN